MRAYLVSIDGVWYAKEAASEHVIACGRCIDIVRAKATNKGYYFTY